MAIVLCIADWRFHMWNSDMHLGISCSLFLPSSVSFFPFLTLFASFLLFQSLPVFFWVFLSLSTSFCSLLTHSSHLLFLFSLSLGIPRSSYPIIRHHILKNAYEIIDFHAKNGGTYPLADILWARWLNESKNNFHLVYSAVIHFIVIFYLHRDYKHFSIELESFVLTPLRFHLGPKEYNAMAPLCRFHIAIKTKLNWQAKTVNHWFSFSSTKSIDCISLHFRRANNDSRIQQIGTRFKQFNS